MYSQGNGQNELTGGFYLLCVFFVYRGAPWRNPSRHTGKDANSTQKGHTVRYRTRNLLAVRLGQMRGGGRWRGEVGSGQGCSGDVLRGEEARLPLWTKFAAVWRWCNDSHISFLVNETWEYNSYRPQICFANGGFKWHTTSLQFSSKTNSKNIVVTVCTFILMYCVMIHHENS